MVGSNLDGDKAHRSRMAFRDRLSGGFHFHHLFLREQEDKSEGNQGGGLSG